MPEHPSAAVVRISSPWPVLHIPVGMVSLGARSDTFYVAVQRV